MHAIVFISLIPETSSIIRKELWIKTYNINASDLNPNLQLTAPKTSVK